MLDIAAETATTPLDADAIRCLQAMKTGALLRFSVEAGAIVAGAVAPSAAPRWSRYGEALGAAFQVADDILDAESTDASARQARRQGRRAQQGDLRLRPRPRRAPSACATRFVEKALAALDAAGLGAEGDIARGRAFRRRAQDLN